MKHLYETGLFWIESTHKIDKRKINDESLSFLLDNGLLTVSEEGKILTLGYREIPDEFEGKYLHKMLSKGKVKIDRK